MTLYHPRNERLVNLGAPRLHAFIIGVGDYPWCKADIQPADQYLLPPLTSTVLSARRIAKWLEAEYQNPGCQLGSIEILISSAGFEEPSLENAREAYKRWRIRCASNTNNIALFYFAGHGLSDPDDRVHCLLLSDFGEGFEIWNCVDFEGFRNGMRGCKAGTQLFFVDACRNVAPALAGTPRGNPFAVTGPNDEMAPSNAFTYFAAATGSTAFGRDNDITFFAEALLTVLNSGAVVDTRSLDSGLSQAVGELRQRHSIHLSYAGENNQDDPSKTVSLHIPRPREPDTHALEESLGYATQAFREYLNEHVVDGVELIYFLSYDTWDGCLLYDGLVQDSIEQKLLNHIRRGFLGRDRLRSKYEKLQSDREKLGAAGRCFHDALNGGDNPIDHLWYIGDLDNYTSEYQAFDRLLGLVSCLYIPVVGGLVPVQPAQHGRPPLGGVLMAGNRRPYGLKPKNAAQIAPGQNPGAFPDKQAARAADRDTAKEITDALRNSGKHRKMRHFLACIGGVYSQKAQSRAGLRDLIHPSLIKKTAKQLTYARAGDRGKAAELLGKKALDRAPFMPVDWPKNWSHALFLDYGGYRQAIQDCIPSEQGRQELVWTYLLAWTWRDLKLKERLALGVSSDATEAIRNDVESDLAMTAIGLEPPITLSDYITKSSEPYWRQLPLDAPVTSHQLEAIDDLIDELRESPKGPFELLLKTLKTLGPTEQYLHGIAEIEGLLTSSHQERYLHQLAHSVQLWILGAWMLDQPLTHETTLRERVLTAMTRRFKSEGDKLGPGPWESLFDDWGKEVGLQLVDLFWGLVAASHDIAAPLQSFQDWCRTFLARYFGERAVGSFDILPLRLDVFHHPRFPFYKSAITNHSRSQQRSWLESIFHLGLSSKIDHALAGSLILMGEIAPDDVYSGDGAWQKVIPYLKQLQSEELAEQGLVLPAYLCHAVAFSHASDMCWRWLNQHPEGSTGLEQRRGVPPEPPYFRKMAAEFRVRFADYPLTYLVALCETLLDPEDGAQLDALVRLRGVQMHQEPSFRRAASTFYVSEINVEKGDVPTMVLSLNLWESQVTTEQKIVSSWRDLENVANFFMNAPAIANQVAWHVFDQTIYDEQLEHWDRLAVYGGWCDVGIDGKIERRLSRPVYEILKMKLRLEHFREVYQHGGGVHFAVKMLNVGTVEQPFRIDLEKAPRS